MQNFRDLVVWQKGHELVLVIYKLTRDFPSEEKYGLVSQLRRAAASVPTNLAEGCGRNSTAELRRFAEIAMGSASEIEYLLLLSGQLNFLNNKIQLEITEQTQEVKRMLSSFIQTLRSRQNN